MSDTRPASTSNPSPGKSSTASTEVSSSIAEQIRQILSTNIVKPNSSTKETTSQPVITKPSLNKLPDIVKLENTILPQSQNHVNEAAKEYVQQQQQKAQPSFSYPKTEPIPVVSSAFNYTSSSSLSTTGSAASYAAPNFSSYNSMLPSFASNSASKPTTSITVPNFVSQTAQYFYQIPSQTVYQSPLNSTAANSATALFQAYSQFNVQPTATPSMVSQHISTQQQQIRK